MNSIEQNAPPHPYIGLRPFALEDHDIFFGREEPIQELLNLLEREQFVAVIGDSGSGKSSLVLAGVLPALHRSTGGRNKDWITLTIRPEADPLGALSDAISESGLSRHDNEKSRNLLDQLEGDDDVSKVYLDFLSARNPDNRPVALVVDQFEELFRFMDEHPINKSDARDFVDILLSDAKDRGFPIYVIVTMAASYSGNCSRFDRLAERVGQGAYFVPKLSEADYRRVICSPAAATECKIAPQVVERILSSMGENDKDSLPMVQHILHQMWHEAQTEGGTDGQVEITEADYEQVGPYGESIAKRGAMILEQFDLEQKHICRHLMAMLSAETSNGEIVRRLSSVDEVAVRAARSPESVARVVEILRDPDVSFLSCSSDEARLDVSHESVFRHWPEAQNWAGEEANSVRLFERLRETAILNRQSNAEYWRGVDLNRALDFRKNHASPDAWRHRCGADFDVIEEFLSESSRSGRNRTFFMRFLVSIVVFLLILMVFAFAQLLEKRRFDQLVELSQLIDDGERIFEEGGSRRDLEEWIADADGHGLSKARSGTEVRLAELREKGKAGPNQEEYSSPIAAWPEKLKQAGSPKAAKKVQAELDRELSQAAKVPLQFEDSRDQVEFGRRQDLLQRLNQVLEPERGLYDKLCDRLNVIKKIEVADRDSKEAWGRMISQMQGMHIYQGIKMHQQSGLVPICISPEGFAEFLHVASHEGELPKFPDSNWIFSESSGVVLVLLPGGNATLGAGEEDKLAERYEKPQYDVVLKPYFISKYEVTQAQWERMSRSKPSQYPISGQAGIHPVESVSWDEGVATLAPFGLTYPSEAQWEFAARGGRSDRWHWGDEKGVLLDVAGKARVNIADATARDANPGFPGYESAIEIRDGFVQHAPVTAFEPNAYGLFNMLGNVAEWCVDRWAKHDAPTVPGTGERIAADNGKRRVRGGSFYSVAGAIRVTRRAHSRTDAKPGYLGIRPVRSLMFE